MRNVGKVRRDWTNFKPAGSKYILKRLAFPAVREGKKLKLLAIMGEGSTGRG
jgi:hypothetical protein